MRLFKTPDQEVAQEFLFWLESSIEKDAKPNKNIKSTYYKPSSLNCLRMMYFYRTSTEIDEVKRPASSIGVLQSGEDRHLRIQNAITKMKQNGYDCEWIDVDTYIKQNNLTNLEVIAKKEYETTVHNKELDLLFLCDGIVKINNKYFIVEIKTENSINFYSRKDVAEEHKHQATCYSISFNINNVLFIYENRDLCSKKVFLFNVTASLKNQVINMIESCNKCVKTNKIPMYIPCKSCTYCDYKKKCEALNASSL